MMNVFSKKISNFCLASSKARRITEQHKEKLNSPDKLVRTCYCNSIQKGVIYQTSSSIQTQSC